jgi:tetratricopeptide (TPR) repeat protein
VGTNSELDQISDLIASGEYVRAGSLLVRLGGKKAELPDSAPPLQRARFFELTGLCAYELKEYGRAARAFTAVISLEEDAGAAAAVLGFSHANLAKALAADRKYEEAAGEIGIAENLLEQDHADDGEKSAIWFGYSQALYRNEQFGIAAAAFRKAAELADKAHSDPAIRSLVWLFAGRSLVPAARFHGLVDQFSATVASMKANGLDAAEAMDKLKPEAGLSGAVNERVIDSFMRAIAAAGETDEFTDTLLHATLDLAVFLQALALHYRAIPFFRSAREHAVTAKSPPRYTGTIHRMLAESLDAVGDGKGARRERLNALGLFTESGEEKLAAEVRVILEGKAAG